MDLAQNVFRNGQWGRYMCVAISHMTLTLPQSPGSSTLHWPLYTWQPHLCLPQLVTPLGHVGCHSYHSKKHRHATPCVRISAVASL